MQGRLPEICERRRYNGIGEGDRQGQKDFIMPLIDKYKTLLFDLDGTLTDPKTGITRSVRYALLKMGIADVDVESLVKFIGPPLKDSYKKYYGFTEEEADLGIAYYREYFAGTGIFENTMYPGIGDLLGALRGEEIRLFVATTKPTVYAEKICDYFDISRYFEEIMGSELDGRLSDKGELIRFIIEKHDIGSSEALMLGDREHDIFGAKRNFIESVGVGYGYGTRAELEAAGATYYAGSIGELSELLLGNQVERTQRL